MPRARYTGGGHYRIDGHGFDPGDEYEVDRELAQYLTDHDDFEVTLQKEDASADVSSDESTDDGDAEATEDDGETFDVEAFLDRTPVEDVVDDIHAGDADGHLDAVAEAADRVTVQDAIGERRAELEG